MGCLKLCDDRLPCTTLLALPPPPFLPSLSFTSALFLSPSPLPFFTNSSSLSPSTYITHLPPPSPSPPHPPPTSLSPSSSPPSYYSKLTLDPDCLQVVLRCPSLLPLFLSSLSVHSHHSVSNSIIIVSMHSHIWLSLILFVSKNRCTKNRCLCACEMRITYGGTSLYK